MFLVQQSSELERSGGGNVGETCLLFAGILRLESNQEDIMPLYHFDLVNSGAIADKGDAELVDDIEAIDSADVIARQLLDERPELKGRHYSVLVTDEEGEEICFLQLDTLH
jgi:hypothetical protein